MNWINVISILGLIGLLSWTFYYVWKNEKKQVNNSDSRNHHDDIKTVSYKLIVPLRIQFPVLIKRVFIPTMTKNDFQFSLLQNVQDEFEHNLAQRLYVSEETWHLISLAKEEVMQNINAVFNDNPDAELSLIAQKLASFDNPMVEKAVKSIKCEFNSL